MGSFACKAFSVILAATAVVAAEMVLYDQDFRTGSAGKASVQGGVFANGWKQVSGQSVRGRILFSSPSPIKRGYAELRFTLDQFGTEYFSSDKNIYFSIYRSPQISQRAAGGHYAYVRIRKEPSRNYFVEFKAYDRPADEGEGETRVCCRDNWTKYIGKEAVMRFAWSDQANVALTYPDPSGSGSKTASRPYKVTGISHIVVGAEGSYNAAVYCFRYLSLKVVDLGGTVPVAYSIDRTGYTEPRELPSVLLGEQGRLGGRFHRLVNLSGSTVTATRSLNTGESGAGFYLPPAGPTR